MFHRLSGVVTAKREGKEIILQFNASVRGRYFEPGYVHFRRLAGGSWSVVRYFLHDAVNVREMAKTYPLTDEEEFIHFVQSVQLCVEAYNDRKCQITRAKEVAQSKELNLFSSIDCMFVMLTVKESNKRSFPVTISLIYEPSGVRPVSLEAQSKGADKKILSKAAEEFEIFKKLSLDEGLAILFLKEEQSNGSPSPEGSSMFHVLEEADHEDERRGSAMRLDSVELTSESDSSDVGSAKVKRKGISLGSRKGVNRPRNHAGSRLVRVSRGSSRGNTGRNANRSVRRDVATSLRSRGRNMKKRR
ncbi:hypothetical protein B7P43_G10741 [Cryptotermes secundus]|nr:hypothetical protein B7P43_G10741 [Cryptotermes secundus]